MVGRDQRRLIDVTDGNLRNNHIYLSAIRDFFPPDCIGGPNRTAKAKAAIEITLDGLGETVTTDIASDPKTGKPRGYFRGRTWVRRFFQYHGVREGSVLSIDKLAERSYRLSVQKNGKPNHPGLRAAEFFAGIGLVRLALEIK